jgi:hypothetical protein
MAKRWSAEDIRDLKTLAREYSVQAIAEKMDRTVGGVGLQGSPARAATEGALAGDRSGTRTLQLDRPQHAACVR